MATPSEQTTATTENPTTETPAADAVVEQQPNPTPQPSSTTETSEPKTADAPVEKTEGDEGDDGLLTGKTEGEDGTTEAAELFGAPEGDYELTGLPEGVTVDADALAAIVPLAKEMNLSSAGLSKLAGVYAEAVLPRVTQQVADAATEALNSQVAQLRKDWAADARAAVAGGKNAAGEDVAPDPIYAGKPLKEVQQTAAKALDRFGGEAFRQYLEESGQTNHPAMLRFAYAAGALLSEDTNFERGGGVPQTPKSREERFYPQAK